MMLTSQLAASHITALVILKSEGRPSDLSITSGFLTDSIFFGDQTIKMLTCFSGIDIKCDFIRDALGLPK